MLALGFDRKGAQPKRKPARAVGLKHSFPQLTMRRCQVSTLLGPLKKGGTKREPKPRKVPMAKTEAPYSPHETVAVPHAELVTYAISAMRLPKENIVLGSALCMHWATASQPPPPHPRTPAPQPLQLQLYLLKTGAVQKLFTSMDPANRNPSARPSKRERRLSSCHPTEARSYPPWCT